MTRLIVLLALLLAPAMAGAQSTTTPTPAPSFPSTTPPFPTSPPLMPSPTVSAHPGGFPWAIGTAIPQGQLLRYVWIAPQTVVVDTILPAQDVVANGAEQIPASESAPQYAVWRQTAVVPGYWVRQTTAGVYYPQRWTLEQAAPGAYRWRLLPAEVRAR